MTNAGQNSTENSGDADIQGDLEDPDKTRNDIPTLNNIAPGEDMRFTQAPDFLI